MPSFKNIHFVVNPAAGQPEPVLYMINKVLYPHELTWSVSLTQADGDGKRLAKQAVDNGADLIVAYGGDGTVKDVVNGLLDTDIPLALLHGGTGNALAFELGIPKSLENAVELIVSDNRLRYVDVGQVICQEDSDTIGYFMLRMSMGLQTKILETASRDLKSQYGNLAYVMASVQELRNSEKSNYHITIDGEEIETQGLTVLIANSAFIGGQANFSFAPAVNPYDGLLDVMIIDDNFDDVIKMVGNALEIDRLDSNPSWQGKEIVVSSPEGQLITLDGERFGHTPATVKILENAVQVLVPPEKD